MPQDPKPLQPLPPEVFHPLRLLKPKGPIVNAMGHCFDEGLLCNRCSRDWNDQRANPIECGSDSEGDAVA